MNVIRRDNYVAGRPQIVKQYVMSGFDEPAEPVGRGGECGENDHRANGYLVVVRRIDVEHISVNTVGKEQREETMTFVCFNEEKSEWDQDLRL
ncbi:hypothetical protein [Geomicrobium sp. JCM 19039]|uniref:hypothetical protein n=1 Tax=Geomicrobium sp. JCM 19039 TaxID=1460636 RepID=UPI00045F3DA9|nr:hypothetical protein [Geomicrobium sp. JCM 19039]GAK10456.1 hypothetical protein JCM19039_70 [Geomicrobium sp. JCM 19039]